MPGSLSKLSKLLVDYAGTIPRQQTTVSPFALRFHLTNFLSIHLECTCHKGFKEKALSSHSPNTAEDLSSGADSEESVGRRGRMKVGALLVGEEGVGYPDLLGHFSAHRHALEVWAFLERESLVPPRLPEIEVRSKVHLYFRDCTYADNLHSDANFHWNAAIIWPHPPVVPTCKEGIQNLRDVLSTLRLSRPQGGWTIIPTGTGDSDGHEENEGPATERHRLSHLKNTVSLRVKLFAVQEKSSGDACSS